MTFASVKNMLIPLLYVILITTLWRLKDYTNHIKYFHFSNFACVVTYGTGMSKNYTMEYTNAPWVWGPFWWLHGGFARQQGQREDYVHMFDRNIIMILSSRNCEVWNLSTDVSRSIDMSRSMSMGKMYNSHHKIIACETVRFQDIFYFRHWNSLRGTNRKRFRQ